MVPLIRPPTWEAAFAFASDTAPPISIALDFVLKDYDPDTSAQMECDARLNFDNGILADAVNKHDK